MGLFGYKPKVSKEEAQKAYSKLRSQGLTDADVDRVKMAFSGDINESQDPQKGIDSVELQGKIADMRKNKSVYNLSEEKIKKIEKALKEKL